MIIENILYRTLKENNNYKAMTKYCAFYKLRETIKNFVNFNTKHGYEYCIHIDDFIVILNRFCYVWTNDLKLFEQPESMVKTNRKIYKEASLIIKLLCLETLKEYIATKKLRLKEKHYEYINKMTERHKASSELKLRYSDVDNIFSMHYSNILPKIDYDTAYMLIK